MGASRRAGNIVDRAEEHETRESYRIHRLIDVTVARFSIDPPRSLTLFFDNGLALAVFNDPNSMSRSEWGGRSAAAVYLAGAFYAATPANSTFSGEHPFA